MNDNFTTDSEAVPEQVKAEFKTRKSRQYSMALLLVPAFGYLLFKSIKTPNATLSEHPFMLVPLAAVIAVLAFSIWNWRCPSCNGYLGRGGNPRFCPKCGVALQ